MATENEILGQLDANAAAIVAAQFKLQGQDQQKMAQLALVKQMDDVTMPNLLAIRATKAIAVTAAQTAKTKAVNLARTNKTNAVATAQTNYNNKVSYRQGREKVSLADTQTAAKWDGWDGAGCVHSNTKGYTGTYCGTYSTWCSDKNTAPYDQATPTNKCLDTTHRYQRQKHAASMKWSTKSTAATSASSVTTAKSNESAAWTALSKAKSDGDWYINRRTLDGDAAIKAAQDKYNTANANYAAYLGSHGIRANAQKKVSWLEQEITKTVAGIAKLSQEKAIFEQNYQKWKDEAVAKQKLIDEAARKAADERISRQKLLDEAAARTEAARIEREKMVTASIAANLKGQDAALAPKSALSVKQDENKMMYGVLGLAVLVAGIYVLKGK